jgi:hypothetical protein
MRTLELLRFSFSSLQSSKLAGQHMLAGTLIAIAVVSIMK